MLAARGRGPPCSFGVSKSILGCNADFTSSFLSLFRYQSYKLSRSEDPHVKRHTWIQLPPQSAWEAKAVCGPIFTQPALTCVECKTASLNVGDLKRKSRLKLRRPCKCRRVTCSIKKSSKSEGPKEDKKPAAAPRVSTTINIPLRYQLRYVKALKEYRKTNDSGPPVRQATGYRRKKERPSESNETPLNGDVVAPSTSLMGQGVMEELNLEPPVLLVDGYNMCGYWAKLKKHFAKGDLESARSKLIVELQMYGACKGIRIVVVFDAQKSGLMSHSEGDKYLEVVYSADDTADSWIEKEAKALHEKGNHNVWVVTSDLAQQSMVYGFGATVWSCGLLIQEINQARKEMLKQLEEDRMIGDLANRQSTFEESVPRASLSQLATLKAQLSRSEDEAFGRYLDVISTRSDSANVSSEDEDSDSEWLHEWSEDELSEGAGSEAQAARIASNGRAGTSDRAEPCKDADHKASTVAIPVAFGKGRVNLGAAVKKRRQAGEGYSSGSDSEGPSNGPRRAGMNLRDPSKDLEIFQRFDTLPDFGYSTGEDEDLRGRMHRRWREDGRKETTNGRALREESNGRADLRAGPVLTEGAAGSGASNGRVHLEASQNGDLKSTREERKASSSVDANENGRLRDDQEIAKGNMEDSGRVAEQNEADELGAPLVIRSKTKRVPGQSPRVAKPRSRASADSDIEEETVGKNGSEIVDGQASRARALNLLHIPRSVKLQAEELGSRKGRAEKRRIVSEGSIGSSRSGNGLRKRSEPAPLLQRAGNDELKHAETLYRDLESTPFEELTKEQLLALKYGHSPQSNKRSRSEGRTQTQK